MVGNNEKRKSMKKLLVILFLLSACSDERPDSLVKVFFGSNISSGFYNTPNTIISTSHAIEDINDPITITYYDNEGKEQQAPATILEMASDYEQVLLHTDVVGEPAPICSGSVFNRITTWGWYKEKPESGTGVIMWKWGKNYRTTAMTYPGFSGGPVFKGDCVIAVHKGRYIALSHDIKIRF